MGFFSWLTADTGESIANCYSVRLVRPVYLLQPYGKAPIEEPAYDGYGNFGEVNALDWLARANLADDQLAKMTKGQIRTAGIALDVGHLYRDVESKKLFSIFHGYGFLIDGVIDFPGRFDEIIPGYGRPLQLINSGRFVAIPVREFFPAFKPLKFSFNPKAVYEDLPASEQCPHQGYFYDEEDGE